MVTLRDVADVTVDFCTQWFCGGRIQTVYAALDKRQPFPARTMVSLHRASKLEVPEGWKALGHELSSTTDTMFEAFNEPGAHNYLNKKITIECQKLVGFDAYKNDWQQLMLLTSVAGFMANPPPAGCKVLIAGIQRRPWLQFAALPLSERVVKFKHVFQNELQWGTIIEQPEGMQVNFNADAAISRRTGVLISRCKYNPETDVAVLPADGGDTFVQMMLGELTVVVEVNSAGEMSVVSTPGISSPCLEQDQLAMSMFCTGWGQKVGIQPESTAMFSGGDTDCSTIYALLDFLGRWPQGLHLITGTTFQWFSPDGVSTITRPHEFTTHYLPYIPAFVLGSDYLLGRHGLAHTTACSSYFIEGFTAFAEGEDVRMLYWQGAPFLIMRNSTQEEFSSFPPITCVCVKTAVFLKWYREILSKAPALCKEREISSSEGGILASRFAWWISYCVNGHLGTLFHDMAPYPGLLPDRINDVPVLLLTNKRDRFPMTNMYKTLVTTIPARLRREDAVTVMASHRFAPSSINIFFCTTQQ